MPNIIETTDTLGRKVICTEDRWTHHIVERHPELVGCEALVKETVENPLIHAEDSLRANREVYYRLSTKMPARYLKVVVDYAESEGEIVTAFSTDSGKQGERLI